MVQSGEIERIIAFFRQVLAETGRVWRQLGQAPQIGLIVHHPVANVHLVPLEEHVLMVAANVLEVDTGDDTGQQVKGTVDQEC
jgi:hypothetical protein